MFASVNSMSYDSTLVVHMLAALGSLVVLVVLRQSAAAVASGASDADQARRFPNRPNFAARIFYLLPLTGFAMSGMGGASVSAGHGWVIAGIVLWVLAAGHLEARVLPSERRIAKAITEHGHADAAAGKKLSLSVDVLLGLIALAVIVMVWQP
jgi:hypothetical protein